MLRKNVNNKQGDFTMFSFIKKIFGSKPAEVEVVAPYKVEAKVEQSTPVAEKAVEAVVKSVAKPAVKKAAPKKKAASSTAPKKTNRTKKPKTK
jgi:hypothetical protein